MKRFFRFRLSTLFLMVLLSAILIQGYQWWTREARAIAKLERQGANFSFFDARTRISGPNEPGYERCEVSVLPTTDLAPIVDIRFLRNLRAEKRVWTSRDAQIVSQCPSLERINADGARGASELLAGTQHLGNLRSLLLRNADVSSDNLALLNPGLELLDLGDCGIDDAGMVWVARLVKLKYLDLDRCQATDRGLAGLQDCQDLAYLSLLRAHEVGDGSLATFAALPKLTKLSLASDRLTDAGARRILDSKSLKYQVFVGGKGVKEATSRAIKDYFHRRGVENR